MKYWVTVTRREPHEESYSLEQRCFENLSEAVETAKVKMLEYPDDMVMIEVEGWRV